MRHPLLEAPVVVRDQVVHRDKEHLDKGTVAAMPLMAHLITVALVAVVLVLLDSTTALIMQVQEA